MMHLIFKKTDLHCMFKSASIHLYMYVYKLNSKATKDSRNITKTGAIKKYKKKNQDTAVRVGIPDHSSLHHYITFPAM